MTDYSELKRLAEEATPGPWKAQHPNAGQRGSEVADASGLNQICADLGPTHALYIAAANPAAVLALIAEIDGLREEVELDNKIIAERDRLLNAIPECAAHEQCVPYAIQWVKDVQVENTQLLEERDQLKAENERLQQFEAAYMEWSNKTDWVQETIQGYELGMHRADVLHKRCRDGAFHQQAQADRIKVLMAEVEALLGGMNKILLETNLHHPAFAIACEVIAELPYTSVATKEPSN